MRSNEQPETTCEVIWRRREARGSESYEFLELGVSCARHRTTPMFQMHQERVHTRSPVQGTRCGMHRAGVHGRHARSGVAPPRLSLGAGRRDRDPRGRAAYRTGDAAPVMGVGCRTPGGGGEASVTHMLQLVEAEMRVAMVLTGVTRVAEIDRGILVRP